MAMSCRSSRRQVFACSRQVLACVRQVLACARKVLAWALFGLTWLAAQGQVTQAQTSAPASPSTQAPTSCSAGEAGSLCEGGGPASQTSDADQTMGVGNPIHVASGNKVQREVDLAPLPGVLGLEIVRHYNSAHSGEFAPLGILGRGWRLSYETELIAIGATIQIVQADGARIMFHRRAGASVCAGTDSMRGEIHVETRRGVDQSYEWRWRDGRRLQFDARGKLTQIALASGEFVSLQHDPSGVLMQVTDPQGRTLRLGYPDHLRRGDNFRGAAFIDSPVGRFTYEYGSAAPADEDPPQRSRLASLVRVGLPSHYDATTVMHRFTDRGVTTRGMSRVYHYEDKRFPTLLSGISVYGEGSDQVARALRISTYRYDAQGRAIESMRGDDSNSRERIRLEFVSAPSPRAPGVTKLTNSLGEQTTYTFAIVNGDYRLLEARGAGCSQCAQTNIRYRYDSHGRTVEATKLSEAGSPIAGIVIERDRLGRQVRIASRRGGRAAPATVRIEYAEESSRPTRVSRPSVVPGREHALVIDYNAAGQPVKVTERGWNPHPVPATIERVTQFRYSQVNGRSLLTEIDGPLANGPKADPSDSDITQIRYDASGHFAAELIAPGPQSTRITRRDAAGRVLETLRADGPFMLRTQTIQGARGHVQWLRRAAWIADRNDHADHDGTPRSNSELSRVTRATYAATDEIASLTVPSGVSWHFEHDVGGQVSALIDPDGNRRRHAFDGEGRLIAWLHEDAAGVVINGRMLVRDSVGQGRALLGPEQLEGLAASRQERVGLSIDDEVPRMSGAPGAPGASGASGVPLVFGVPEALPAIAWRDSYGNLEGQLRDDFGRIVLIREAASGWITFRYGGGVVHEAAHIAIIRTGTDRVMRSDERLEFDYTGRLRARTRGPCRERFEYSGQLLQTIEGCRERQHFERDAFGQITAHKQTIDPLGLAEQTDSTAGAAVVVVQRYRYDRDSGALDARQLPNGDWLRYRYAANAGRLSDIKIEARWLSSLRRLFASAWVDQAAQWLQDRVPTLGAKAVLISHLRYLAFGARAGYDQFDRTTTSLGYNRSGRLVGHIVKAIDTGELLHIESRRYGHEGQLAQSKRNGGTTDYRFADDGRLLRWFDDADAAHNTHNAHNAGNRLSATLPAARDPRARHFDPFGRLIRRAHHNEQQREEQQLTYDNAGRLVSIERMSAAGEFEPVARYRTNAQGQRIAKATVDQVVYFAYDLQGRIAAELSPIEGGGVRVAKQFFHLGHQPYAMHDLQADRIYALHADSTGLVQAVSDANGKLVWQVHGAQGAQGEVSRSSVAWSPFGAVVSGAALTAVNAMPLRFAGQYYDSESGLHYNGHRYYEPRTGRYITPDPIGTPDGPDRFAYVNGNPLQAVDAKGLFKIPSPDFVGFATAPRTDGGGHGDILRAAFAQYTADVHEVRFSETIIDQMIRNDYHTDSLGIGGGQMFEPNHFDNPNDGPMYVSASDRTLLPKYADGDRDDWILDSITQLNNNRSVYSTVGRRGIAFDISDIVGRFGQNAHTLADFYAHTNWVDAAARGGCVKNSKGVFFGEVEPQKSEPGIVYERVSSGGKTFTKIYEVGYVPTGLNEHRLWNEETDAVSRSKLFSGTVELSNIAGCVHDVLCKTDKTSHGYWNKDNEDSDPPENRLTPAETDALARDGLFFWRARIWDGKVRPPGSLGVDYLTDTGLEPRAGDRIYTRETIRNRFQLAYELAVKDTKREIAKLYETAESTRVGSLTLGDVFKLNLRQLDANFVIFQRYVSKKSSA